MTNPYEPSKAYVYLSLEDYERLRRDLESAREMNGQLSREAGDLRAELAGVRESYGVDALALAADAEKIAKERDQARAELKEVLDARDKAAGGPDCRLPTWAEIEAMTETAKALWTAAWNARAAITGAKDPEKAVAILSEVISATTDPLWPNPRVSITVVPRDAGGKS